MLYSVLSFSLLLLGSASALPFTSKSRLALLPRESGAPVAIVNGVTSVNSDGSVNQAGTNQLICGLADEIGSTNPQQLWANSGASDLLESFIVANGDVNWLENLAKQSNDTIDCTQIDKGNLCPSPESCEKEDDARFFFIRTAAANCFAFFQAALDQNRDNLAETSNNVDTLLQDFGPPPQDDNTGNILNDISGILGIASAATGNEAAAAGFGVLSSILSIAGSNVPTPDPADEAAQLKTTLNNIFNGLHDTIVSSLELIFAGSDNSTLTASLPGVSSSLGPNGETTNIAKFFADGAFLDSHADASSIAHSIDFVMQGLVSSFLKSENKYVFVDANRNQDDCNAIHGSQFINNQCYTIEEFGHTPAVVEKIDVTTQPIDSTQADKLSQPPYNFNLNNFYLNAADCQQAHPDFTGVVTPGDITAAAGGFPRCFFNLPVITAADSPCNALDQNLPSNLGFNTASCTAPLSGDVPGGAKSTPGGGPGIDIVLGNGTHAANATLITASALHSSNHTQGGNYLVISNQTVSR